MHPEIRNFYDNILLNIEDYLNRSSNYFIQIPESMNPKDYAGWKFTIVGKSVADAVYLADKLGTFLMNINVGFKIGTKKLINHNDGEQQYKLMTIYISRTTNAELLEEDIKHFLRDYKGGEGVQLKWSEQINEYLYKRVDIDKDGNYVYANPDKQ